MHKEMAEHVSSRIHVFRTKKYRLLLLDGPTYRKGNSQENDLTVNVTITDPQRSVTFHKMYDYERTHSGRKNTGEVGNKTHTLSLASTLTRSANLNQDGWTATPAGLAEVRLPP